MLVDRDGLTGFRTPAAKEKAGITNYFKKKISAELRVMSFWSAVCSILAGGFLWNLVSDVHPGDRREDMVCLVFLCIAAFILFQIRLSRKRKKALLLRIADGEYGVMECRAYEVKFDISLVGQAEAKIFNGSGQYCKTCFLLDETTAKRCKSREEVRLLLLKCSDGFYELLSEQKMGVRKDELN